MINWRLGRDDAAIIRHIAGGGVLAYPTEAVYGLGGDPGNAATVAEILVLKRGRSPEKGLIMVAANWGQCTDWIADGLTQAEKQGMAKISAERPTTFILPAGKRVTPALTDRATGRVALRISTHPVVVGLCELLGQPLISTSANLAGEEPTRTVAEVNALFPQLPVIAGSLGGDARTSRVMDWENKIMIRE